MAKTPVILLAAGNSSRMGRPKQLLRWGEQTLIEHQIQTLAQTGENVIVVLGANADLIMPFLNKHSLTIVINDAWKSGMASSIVCGISEVNLLYPTADAALITLVDQPLIPAGHFKNLMNALRRGCQQIVASASAEGWLGVPALFDKCYFDELLSLRGEKGAKSLIQKYPNQVEALECNEIVKDIDTLEAYQELYQKHFKKV